jgi:hypothetical protein
MSNPKLRLTITRVYEADPKNYDTDDAGEMARIDHDLFQDDPAAAFEALEGGVDYEIKVEVESL